MGKQKRKVHLKPIKKSKWDRTCERCGEDNFVPYKKIWTCRFCNYKNEGEQYDIQRTID